KARSVLPEDEVQHPAAADVFPRLAAMVEDVSVRAARFFEGVREDGEVREAALGIDRPGEVQDGPVLPGTDFGAEDDRSIRAHLTALHAPPGYPLLQLVR